MADETVDPTQPATEPVQPDPAPAVDPAPASAEEPAEAPAPVPPAVTPDPSGDTPTTSSDDEGVPVGNAPEDAPAPVGAQAVVVDNYTKRDDDDALAGSWVDVISGPLAGRFGAYVDTVHFDADSGYPSVILIRSRDERNELLEVAYSDVRPSERTGGR